MKYLFILFILFGLISCQNSSEEKDTESIAKIEIVSKTFPKLDPSRYNVGFLIMDGVYNTELTAPYDIFQHTIFRKNIKAISFL